MDPYSMKGVDIKEAIKKHFPKDFRSDTSSSDCDSQSDSDDFRPGSLLDTYSTDTIQHCFPEPVIEPLPGPNSINSTPKKKKKKAKNESQTSNGSKENDTRIVNSYKALFSERELETLEENLSKIQEGEKNKSVINDNKTVSKGDCSNKSGNNGVSGDSSSKGKGTKGNKNVDETGGVKSEQQKSKNKNGAEIKQEVAVSKNGAKKKKTGESSVEVKKTKTAVESAKGENSKKGKKGVENGINAGKAKTTVENSKGGKSVKENIVEKSKVEETAEKSNGNNKKKKKVAKNSSNSKINVEMVTEVLMAPGKNAMENSNVDNGAKSAAVPEKILKKNKKKKSTKNNEKGKTVHENFKCTDERNSDRRPLFDQFIEDADQVLLSETNETTKVTEKSEDNFMYSKLSNARNIDKSTSGTSSKNISSWPTDLKPIPIFSMDIDFPPLKKQNENTINEDQGDEVSDEIVEVLNGIEMNEQWNEKIPKTDEEDSSFGEYVSEPTNSEIRVVVKTAKEVIVDEFNCSKDLHGEPEKQGEHLELKNKESPIEGKTKKKKKKKNQQNNEKGLNSTTNNESEEHPVNINSNNEADLKPVENLPNTLSSISTKTEEDCSTANKNILIQDSLESKIQDQIESLEMAKITETLREIKNIVRLSNLLTAKAGDINFNKSSLIEEMKEHENTVANMLKNVVESSGSADKSPKNKKGGKKKSSEPNARDEEYIDKSLNLEDSEVADKSPKNKKGGVKKSSEPNAHDEEYIDKSLNLEDSEVADKSPKNKKGGKKKSSEPNARDEEYIDKSLNLEDSEVADKSPKNKKGGVKKSSEPNARDEEYIDKSLNLEDSEIVNKSPKNKKGGKKKSSEPNAHDEEYIDKSLNLEDSEVADKSPKNKKGEVKKSSEPNVRDEEYIEKSLNLEDSEVADKSPKNKKGGKKKSSEPNARDEEYIDKSLNLEDSEVADKSPKNKKGEVKKSSEPNVRDEEYIEKSLNLEDSEVADKSPKNKKGGKKKSSEPNARDEEYIDKSLNLEDSEVVVAKEILTNKNPDPEIIENLEAESVINEDSSFEMSYYSADINSSATSLYLSFTSNDTSFSTSTCLNESQKDHSTSSEIPSNDSQELILQTENPVEDSTTKKKRKKRKKKNKVESSVINNNESILNVEKNESTEQPIEKEDLPEDIPVDIDNVSATFENVTKVLMDCLSSNSKAGLNNEVVLTQKDIQNMNKNDLDILINAKQQSVDARSKSPYQRKITIKTENRVTTLTQKDLESVNKNDVDILINTKQQSDDDPSKSHKTKTLAYKTKITLTKTNIENVNKNNLAVLINTKQQSGNDKLKSPEKKKLSNKKEIPVISTKKEGNNDPCTKQEKPADQPKQIENVVNKEKESGKISLDEAYVELLARNFLAGSISIEEIWYSVLGQDFWLHKMGISDNKKRTSNNLKIPNSLIPRFIPKIEEQNMEVYNFYRAINRDLISFCHEQFSKTHFVSFKINDATGEITYEEKRNRKLF